MSKLIKPNVPFGMVPNSLLNSKNVSLKAKGLFAFIQSKPDGWNFSVEKISFQCKEAKSSVSEGLKELEVFGYLLRKQSHEKGRLGAIDYELFFKPKAKKQFTEILFTENQQTVKQSTEKLLNGKSANISNKDNSNKDNSKKEKREEGSLAFFQENYPSRFEIVMMQFKSKITDYSKFELLFEATVLQEKLLFDGDVIEGRFRKFAINWISNQNKFEQKVIELNPNQRKEKIGGI
jgi:hypothetical protein